MEKLGRNMLIEIRVRDNHIETFKVMEILIIVGFFFLNISPRTENLLWRKISKSESNNQMDSFCK